MLGTIGGGHPVREAFADVPSPLEGDVGMGAVVGRIKLVVLVAGAIDVGAGDVVVVTAGGTAEDTSGKEEKVVRKRKDAIRRRI